MGSNLQHEQLARVFTTETHVEVSTPARVCVHVPACLCNHNTHAGMGAKPVCCWS